MVLAVSVVVVFLPRSDFLPATHHHSNIVLPSAPLKPDVRVLRPGLAGCLLACLCYCYFCCLVTFSIEPNLVWIIYAVSACDGRKSYGRSRHRCVCRKCGIIRSLRETRTLDRHTKLALSMLVCDDLAKAIKAGTFANNSEVSGAVWHCFTVLNICLCGRSLSASCLLYTSRCV